MKLTLSEEKSDSPRSVVIYTGNDEMSVPDLVDEFKMLLVAYGFGKEYVDEVFNESQPEPEEKS